MEFWQNFCSKILFHVGGYEERVLYSIRNLFFEFQPVYTSDIKGISLKLLQIRTSNKF